MDTRSDDRSLGELFSELTRQMSALVRQEVNLAKTEMTQKARDVGKDTGYLAVGAAVAYAGFLMLLVALTLLLGIWIPMWVSALIVGGVVAGVGAFLVLRGRDHLTKTSLAPQQTVDTLKETAQWAKQQTS
jgi:putative superfamily III holin-X